MLLNRFQERGRVVPTNNKDREIRIAQMTDRLQQAWKAFAFPVIANQKNGKIAGLQMKFPPCAGPEHFPASRLKAFVIEAVVRDSDVAGATVEARQITGGFAGNSHERNVLVRVDPALKGCYQPIVDAAVGQLMPGLPWVAVEA